MVTKADWTYPPDFEQDDIDIIDKVKYHTITSKLRIHALIQAVRYIVANDIPGDFVECGVYLGGSMMTVAHTLQMENVTNRDLYLFDTFEGMPKPQERDIDFKGESALSNFEEKKITDKSSKWVNASLDKVKEAMSTTGYPMERVHFVKGMVEDTVPAHSPESIAMLRLDTDWYSSTKHEMTHLYPLVNPRGIVVIDDYGHFKGAREAVDEYFEARGEHPFLHRIDYTGRMIVKL